MDRYLKFQQLILAATQGEDNKKRAMGSPVSRTDSSLAVHFHDSASRTSAKCSNDNGEDTHQLNSHLFSKMMDYRRKEKQSTKVGIMGAEGFLSCEDFVRFCSDVNVDTSLATEVCRYFVQTLA